MTGGVSAKAAHAEAAKAFIAYLAGPAIEAHVKASGMERVPAVAHH
jgi:ABC-type Fe3+ transport system substrate-binding protein